MTIVIASVWVRTVDHGSFAPFFASSIVARLPHFATVLGLRLLKCESEVWDCRPAALIESPSRSLLSKPLPVRCA